MKFKTNLVESLEARTLFAGDPVAGTLQDASQAAAQQEKVIAAIKDAAVVVTSGQACRRSRSAKQPHLAVPRCRSGT